MERELFSSREKISITTRLEKDYERDHRSEWLEEQYSTDGKEHGSAPFCRVRRSASIIGESLLLPESDRVTWLGI